jgi:nitric oxide reductase large subunit
VDGPLPLADHVLPRGQSFWNLVGAGLFGFLINPPLSLYYMQGLNLTPLHGHTALFGVYGMLGIGLMLFCLRGLRRTMVWDTRAAPGLVLVPQHRPGADGRC